MLMITQWEMILRLILSALAGALIGMEREANNRPAGLRTHTLVTLGSSLIMMISMYGFGGGDPARLAAQVVSGIGFLGAGTIMISGSNIKGLTTAASLWVCGGIGLAIGNGYYVGGVATTIIVLFTLVTLGVLEKRLFKRKYRVLFVKCQDKPGKIGAIGQVCGNHYVSIKDISIIHDNSDSEGNEIADIEDSKDSYIDVYVSVKIPTSFNNRSFIEDVKLLDGVEDVVWMSKESV
jgi:putative Mg2+ transporter-C (MgtC) family protein